MTLFGGYEKWKREKRFNQAKWALKLMIEKKDPEIYGQMQAIADSLAIKKIMAWFDNRRINHCAHCHIDKPLRAFKGIYYCEKHFIETQTPTAEAIIHGN